MLNIKCLSLFQQIFLTQESNQGLLHCRQISLPTELSGKPKTLIATLVNQGSLFTGVSHMLFMHLFIQQIFIECIQY